MMSNWDYILGGILLALFIYEVVFYSVYQAGVPRLLRRLRKSNQRSITSDSITGDSITTPDAPGETKGVSIIVCAHNEEVNLNDYLQSLMTQDYPTYEIIVVNDRSDDATWEVIENYTHRDHRIRMSFIPKDTTVMSTKKLGITLGAKAAKYDYLLLTDADCRPESKQWISRMMAPFARPEIEVVLGYSPYFERPTQLNRIIAYDNLFNGLNYMGSALVGHPYMGVGRNLAYRKELFFRSGGFSDLMNYLGGDDDLFVRKVATGTNTAVVATPDSYTWTRAKETMEDWMQQRRRHLSVSTAYSAWSKWHLGLEPMARGLFYALVIVLPILSAVGILSWWTALAVGVMALARLILQLSVINVAAKRMGLRGYGLRLVWYDICLPIINLYIFLTQPLHRRQNRW